MRDFITHMGGNVFDSLDHVAIVVKNTEEALRFYSDTLELPLVFREVLDDQAVRLTHLDMNNVHLQLVEPLTKDHILQSFLKQQGEALHHICFQVKDIKEMMLLLKERGLILRDQQPRSGPCGKQAVFIDPKSTKGLLFEITA
jgi:methylmalonyl-CoA/ethylmalonyl-CoA epimerase